MDTSEDRRAHARYPAEGLRVMASSLRTDNGEWVPAEIGAVDFNRYGISLETDHKFIVGDILALVIRTDDGTVAEVYGLICNRRTMDYGYRFGIRFVDNAERNEQVGAMINISEEMLMLERQAAAIH